VADTVAARGRWGTVEWAVDARGRTPAREFYEGLQPDDRAKVDALFGRFAETGKIHNTEKFKKLRAVRGRDLYEFKCFQLRFIGAFAPGFRFLVAHAVRKKKDEHSQADLECGARVLNEHHSRGMP